MRRLCSVLAMLLVAATACSDGGSGEGAVVDDAAGGASGSIQVLVTGDPLEMAAYQELVDAFADVEPEIEVRLIRASDRSDQMTRLSTSFAGGNPPEVFLMNYLFVGQFAARDVLLPLDDRLADSEAMAEDDFFDVALDAFRFDGSLLCLPQNLSSLVVYYNRDLFAEEGVTEPEPGWQWREFVEKAKALTKDLDGDGASDQYGLGIDADSLMRLMPFVWSAGAEVFDDPERPTRFTLDTPEARVALGEFFALHRAHGVIPSEEELRSESDESRFLNGRTAMLVESRRVVPILRTITDFDWDVAPLPLLGRPTSLLHSDGYCLTRDGANPEAAWRFVEFALSPQGAEIMAQTGRTVPSRKEVAESEVFLDPGAKPANSQVFLDAGATLRAGPHISTWAEIEAAVRTVLEFAMYDDVPPDTISDRLNLLTAEMFARAQDD